MSEIINEKVSVVSFYNHDCGKVMPWLVRWHGHLYKIKNVGLHYPVKEGKKLLHYFSVLTDSNVSLKLRHDTETLHWTLEEVVDEFTS